MGNLREKLEKYLPVLVFEAIRKHISGEFTAKAWADVMQKPLGSTPNKTVYAIAAFISSVTPEAEINVQDIMSTEVLITFNTGTGQFGKATLQNSERENALTSFAKKFLDYYTQGVAMSYVTT